MSKQDRLISHRAVRNLMVMRLLIGISLMVVAAAGCNGERPTDRVPLEIPRGYVDRLYIDTLEGMFFFGPFVGYYFKPITSSDRTRLRFVTFNEGQFYTLDLPENAKLYHGEARLVHLPKTDHELPRKNRINPVFFDQAPVQWLKSRPAPQDQFIHFHSCYDASGPVRAGYWLKHIAVETFVYDMGGRVTKESPLYHSVKPGPDTAFARIVEFDRGP